MGTWGGFGASLQYRAMNDTIATDLQNDGYKTGLVGKYLNGYNPRTNYTYVPPEDLLDGFSGPMGDWSSCTQALIVAGRRHRFPTSDLMGLGNFGVMSRLDPPPALIPELDGDVGQANDVREQVRGQPAFVLTPEHHPWSVRRLRGGLKSRRLDFRRSATTATRRPARPICDRFGYVTTSTQATLRAELHGRELSSVAESAACCLPMLTLDLRPRDLDAGVGLHELAVVWHVRTVGSPFFLRPNMLALLSFRDWTTANVIARRAP
jgi:hypothetical protein